MDLLKNFLNKEVTVLISNDAMGVPTPPLSAVWSQGMSVQEIVGTLTGFDDTHPMLEITTDDAVQVVNWHDVVTIICAK